MYAVKMLGEGRRKFLEHGFVSRRSERGKRFAQNGVLRTSQNVLILNVFMTPGQPATLQGVHCPGAFVFGRFRTKRQRFQVSRKPTTQRPTERRRPVSLKRATD